MEVTESKARQLSNLVEELFDNKYKKSLSISDIASIYHYTQPDPTTILFTKEDEQGNIVAMATLYHVRLLTRHLGFIEGVCVLKEHRGKGIATELVTKAVEKARSLGCDCVELTVRNDKPEVRRLYEKLGFRDRKNLSMRLWLNNKYE